jgi:uncharacterized MAPEG superfamily protein
MGTELGILGLYGLLLMVILTAEVLGNLSQVRLSVLVGSQDDIPPYTGVVLRLKRASLNSVVAMALFAPAVLINQVMGVSTPGTLLAAQLFLIARALYPIAYVSGIPWTRTLIWTVGFLATGWIYLVGLMATPTV